MPQTHLDALLLDKLLRGDVSAITSAEARELAWHLMETCPDCCADVEWALGETVEDSLEEHRASPTVRHATSSSQNAKGGEAFDAVFERVRQRVRSTMSHLESSSKAAPSLVNEFLLQSPARQKLLALNDRRFQTLAVAELLLEKAWELGFDNAAEAEAIAEIVLEIVDRVEVAGLSERVVNDVRCRAWGLRGNFRRIRADYRGSEAAFAQAREFLAEGTGDLLERARLLTLESTLCRYLKQKDRAGQMLEETIRIYRMLDEQHLVGRTMVNQALLLNEQGESSRAIETLRKAQKLIDPQREPHLARVAQQNLMVYLSDVGGYEEAMAMIPSLRHKLVAEGTRVELLRLRWLEGTIHLGLGNEARAEAAYLEVRRGMVELELPKDAATVSLELAALYMRQRRTGEIRDLASQMFPIFQSRDLHQEAIAALLLFQRAVEMDTLTLRMVEEVADVVRRSQDKPRPQTPEPS